MQFKTYSGEKWGTRYAYGLLSVDLAEPHARKRARHMLGYDGLDDFRKRIRAGRTDCTTCGQQIGPQPQPRTLVLFAHPVQAVILCACQECTARYGGCEEATRMCGEYLVGQSLDPDAAVHQVPVAELREHMTPQPGCECPSCGDIDPATGDFISIVPALPRETKNPRDGA